MAAEVSKQFKSESKPGPGGPITRDFLGGCSGIESKELELDLQVPAGWEKRLDLNSGKVYVQRCIQPSPASDRKRTNSTNQTAHSSSNPKTTLSLFEDTNLDLKLVPKSPPNALVNYKNATYQSVCTLEKVKLALEEARKVSSFPATLSSKKRPSASNFDSSISINKNNVEEKDLNSQSFCRDHNRSEDNQDGKNGMLVAGACPGCLLYVLIPKTNPKCPKCDSVIPLPAMPKKPRIDLNVSM